MFSTAIRHKTRGNFKRRIEIPIVQIVRKRKVQALQFESGRFALAFVVEPERIEQVDKDIRFSWNASLRSEHLLKIAVQHGIARCRRKREFDEFINFEIDRRSKQKIAVCRTKEIRNYARRKSGCDFDAVFPKVKRILRQSICKRKRIRQKLFFGTHFPSLL